MAEPRVLVSNEETTSSLIEMLASGGSKDTSIFYQIRDFFFELSQQDFDRLSREMSLAIVRSLSDSVIRVRDSSQTDYLSLAKYLQAGLSLLLYLGYKLQYSLHDIAHIDILLSKSAEFDEISLNSFVKIVIYSWQYKDHDQASYEFLFTRITNFYPVVTNKLQKLSETIPKIRPAQYSTIFTLIQCFMMCGKINERTRQEFVKTLKIFQEIVSRPINLDSSTCHNISQFSILMKMCFTIFNSQIQEIDNSSMVNTMLDLFDKIPPYFNSLVEDFFQSSNQILRNEIEKQDNIPRLIASTYSFKNITPDSLPAYANFAHFLADALIKQQKTKSAFITQFCKFTSSVIQYHQMPFRNRNANFYQLLPLVKIPSEGPLRSSLLEVFFYSLHLELMECENNFNIAIKKVMKSGKDSYSALHQSIESINTIVKCFDSFLHITQTKNLQQTKPVTAFLDSNINSFTAELISKIYVRLCIIILKNRKPLQIFESAKNFVPSANVDQNIESIVENQKIVKSWIHLCNFHQDIANALVNTLQSSTSVIQETIWPQLIEIFFAFDPKITFDSCLSRALYGNIVAFSSFMRAMSNYVVDHWPESHNLQPIISSIKFLFEKIFSKKANPNSDAPLTPKDQVYNESITHSVCRICSRVRDLISIERYAADAFSLLVTANKYCDLGDINEIFDQIAITPRSSVLICEYLTMMSNKINIKQTTTIINTLIKTVCFCKAESLKLLYNFYKQDKKMFSRQDIMIQEMSDYIFANLDKTNGEQKKLLLKFLHHMPAKYQVERFEAKWFVNNEKTLTFTRENDKYSIPLKSYFDSLWRSLARKNSDENAWKAIINLINLMLNVQDWNSEYKIFILTAISDAFFNINYCDNVDQTFSSMVTIENDSKIATICAIASIAYISNYPKSNSQLISLMLNRISDKTRFKQFIEELSFFTLSKRLPSPYVIQDICEIIINNAEKDLIDPISFALLVSHMITATTSQTWKESQRVDGIMNFIELDLLPKRSQKIINFVRQLMRDSNSDVFPLLEESKMSTCFLTNLVMCEMLSECQCSQEIIDFISNLLTEFCHDELRMFRTVGTLLRAFPHAYNDLAPKLASVVSSRMEGIEEKDKKYQTTFLVIVVPVLEHSNGNVTNYFNILKIALSHLERPPSYIKCQAQLIIRAMWTHGDNKVKSEIYNFATSYMKERGFQNAVIKDFQNLSWSAISSSLFSYVFYDARLFIENMLKYLELLPDAVKVNQDLLTNDLLKNIVALYELGSTGIIAKKSCDTRQFRKLGKALLKALAAIPILQFPTILNSMAIYMSSNPVGIKDLFNDALASDGLLEIVAKIVDHPAISDHSNNFVAENHNQILEILKEQDKKDRRQEFLISWLIKVPNIEQKQDLVEHFFDMHKYMCSTLSTKIEAFDGPFLLKLSEFLAKHFTQRYLGLFYVFTYFEPILSSTFLHALENSVDFDTFEADFLKHLHMTEDYIVDIAYYELVSVTVLRRRKDLIQGVIEFCVENLPLKITLTLFNAMIKNKLEIDFEQFDFLQIYDLCKTDNERIETILMWANSKTSENFIILFSHLIDFLHVHSDSRIKNALNAITIPKDVNQNTVANILLDSFLKYLRCHSIQSNLLSLVARNSQFFDHPTLTFLQPIQEKLKVIESNIQTHENSNRKHTLLAFSGTILDIVNILSNNQLSEKLFNALGTHITYITNVLLKIITESVEVTFKYRNEFTDLINSIGKFTVMFPTTNVAIKVFEIFAIFTAKTKEQKQSKTLAMSYEILYSGMKDIIDGVVQNTEFTQLEGSIDVFVDSIRQKDPNIWPHALQCLNRILRSYRWRDKAIEKLKPLFTTEVFGFVFPLFWAYCRPHINKVLSSVETGLTTVRSMLNDIPKYGALTHSIMFLMLNLNNNSVNQYMYSLLSNAADQKDSKISGYIMEIITSDFFKEASFRPRFIDLLKNTSLAAAFFDRGQPSDEIVNLMPLEALIVLSNHKNVTVSCIKRLKEFDFTEVLLSSAKMSINGPAASLLISSLVGIDVTGVCTYLQNVDLPRRALALFNSKSDVMKVIRIGNSGLLSEEAERELRLLSNFPDLEDYNQSNYSDAKVLYRINETHMAMKYLDDSMNNYAGRSIVSDLKIGDRHLLMLIRQDSQIEAKLSGIFNHCDCLRDAATREGLCEYMIAHEVKRVAAALKKHADGFMAFKYQLPPQCSISIHKYYKELRDLTCKKFTVNNATAIDSIHMKVFAKAEKIHNSTDIRLPQLSTLVDLAKNQKSLKAVFMATKLAKLSAETVDKAAAALLMKKPDSLLPFTLFGDSSNEAMQLTKKVISNGKIPFGISQFMAEKILEKDNLKLLQPFVHSAFSMIFSINSNTQKKDQFLANVYKVCETEAAQKQKEIFVFAKNQISKLQKDEQTDVFNDDGIEILHQQLFTHQLDGCQLPLMQIQETCYSFSAFVENDDDSDIKIRITTNSGNFVFYRVSPFSRMSTRVSLLSRLLSTVYMKMPGTWSRGMTLTSIDSVDLKNGFFLSQTSSDPIFKLLDLKEIVNDKITKPKLHSLLTSEEFVFWFNTAGTRYAGLFIAQALIGGGVPSPISIFVDERNASFFISDRDSPLQVLPRLVGRITRYFDDIILKGPFRNSLLAAADAISRNRTKVKVYIESVFREEIRESDVIKQLSPLERDSPSDALTDADRVIHDAINISEKYVIPWI